MHPNQTAPSFLLFAQRKEQTRPNVPFGTGGESTAVPTSRDGVEQMNLIEHFLSYATQDGMILFMLNTRCRPGYQMNYRKCFPSTIQELLHGIFQRLIFRRARQNIINETTSEKYSACSMHKPKALQAKDVK